MRSEKSHFYLQFTIYDPSEAGQFLRFINSDLSPYPLSKGEGQRHWISGNLHLFKFSTLFSCLYRFGQLAEQEGIIKQSVTSP